MLAAQPQTEGLQYPGAAVLTDPVALLQKRIERGQTRLRFAADRGYLPSILKELQIPASSQTLVFSKTSLQTDKISRTTPRAIYFNDDVYVGWIPDAPMVEMASVDPKYGTVFYTVPQVESKSPTFVRLEQPCISCHGPVEASVPAPLLLMMSTATDEAGEILNEFLLTTDRSPMKERWGGWYVTGSTGGAAHLGKPIPSDTRKYLASHSDTVSLMLLAHQADVHNRISEVAQKLRISTAPPVLADVVEPLVQVLLFSDEAPLAAPVRGVSSFTKDFTAKGPKDRRGRSLRDFDLQRRLFRYPVSYLIYSESFRQLPPPAKEAVYRRLREVLSGKDPATLEILSATLPGFAAPRSGAGN